MPNENLLDLTDEEIRHFADRIRGLASVDDVIRSLYADGLLSFGDYGDRAHLRASWAAMSACLIKLSKHEEPDPDLLAQVPSSHRVYLLGQAATHRQNAEMGRRLRVAQSALAALMDGQSPATRDALFTVIEVLRGEKTDVVPLSLNGCDDCSVEAGEPHRYPGCPGAVHVRMSATVVA